MLSVFFAVVFPFRWVKYMDKSSTGQQPFQDCVQQFFSWAATISRLSHQCLLWCDSKIVWGEGFFCGCGGGSGFVWRKRHFKGACGG